MHGILGHTAKDLGMSFTTELKLFSNKSIYSGNLKDRQQQTFFFTKQNVYKLQSSFSHNHNSGFSTYNVFLISICT